MDIDKKHAYIASIEQDIETWSSEIQKFRIIAEVADKDAQIVHYGIIEDIDDKKKTVVQKLDQLKLDSSGDWSALKEEIDTACKTVEKAIESAYVKIN